MKDELSFQSCLSKKEQVLVSKISLVLGKKAFWAPNHLHFRTRPHEDSYFHFKFLKTDLSGILILLLMCKIMSTLWRSHRQLQWVSCLHALCSMGSCVDSHAWLIAVPDKILPAIAPTELAVHWEWECVSSNWTVVSLMLLDPLRIQGCSPSCPAECFSPPKLCQDLVRELCSRYIPVLTLDRCCPLWLSHLHPGCAGIHFCSSSSREQPKCAYQCGLLHTYHTKALVGCRGRGKWRGRKRERPSSSEDLGIWDPYQCGSAWTLKDCMALWACPPLFLLGETMPLGWWLLCYKTVFHSTAPSLRPFNTHCWLVQTPSPFPLNHPHRIWPPSLRNASLSFMYVCVCAHAQTHVHAHTSVCIHTHLCWRKVWIPPPLVHYKPGAFLGLCQWADANILRRRHGVQFHKLD